MVPAMRRLSALSHHLVWSTLVWLTEQKLWTEHPNLLPGAVQKPGFPVAGVERAQPNFGRELQSRASGGVLKLR
jgi:hypothetical protein